MLSGCLVDFFDLPKCIQALSGPVYIEEWENRGITLISEGGVDYFSTMVIASASSLVTKPF